MSAVPEASEQDAHYRALNAQRRLARWEPATLRAAWWAWRSVRAARRDLREHGLQATVTPPPTALPWGSRTGVNGVLARFEPTCLERSLVLQAWLAAHRIPRDIVVGVGRGESDSVRAHAWIEGIADATDHDRYTEIHRIAPR